MITTLLSEVGSTFHIDFCEKCGKINCGHCANSLEQFNDDLKIRPPYLFRKNDAKEHKGEIDKVKFIENSTDSTPIAHFKFSNLRKLLGGKTFGPNYDINA